MSVEIDPEACEKTPEAIREALQRKPAWLTLFTRSWMSAATKFDQGALDAVLDKFHTMALACATPGYMERLDAEIGKINSGDTADMTLVDETGAEVPWDRSERAHSA